MANKVANAATVGGLGVSAILMATAPPLGLLGATAIIVARICRKMRDDENERQARRKSSRTRDISMLNYPIIPNSSFGLTPYSSFPIMTTSPETEIARFKPNLGAKVLLQQSLDQSLTSLANSTVATEFARQGRGTYAAARRRIHFFGLAGETTELIVRPID